jgi:hypothetical protein
MDHILRADQNAHAQQNKGKKRLAQICNLPGCEVFSISAAVRKTLLFTIVL